VRVVEQPHTNQGRMGCLFSKLDGGVEATADGAGGGKQYSWWVHFSVLLFPCVGGATRNDWSYRTRSSGIVSRLQPWAP